MREILNSWIHSVIIWLQNTWTMQLNCLGVICRSLFALLELKVHVHVHFCSFRVAPAVLLLTLKLDFQIFGQNVYFWKFVILLLVDSFGFFSTDITTNSNTSLIHKDMYLFFFSHHLEAFLHFLFSEVTAAFSEQQREEAPGWQDQLPSSASLNTMLTSHIHTMCITRISETLTWLG